MAITAALIHDSLDAGLSVAAIAEQAGCTPGRVYQVMRALGRTAQQVAAEQSNRPTTAIECRTHVGYRVCTSDGRVQSCWSIGQNSVRTKFWRDLIISQANGRLFVQLGGSRDNRKRLSLRTIYRDSFNAIREHKADDLYEQMRAKLIRQG